LVLAALTIVAFWQVGGHPFVLYDDDRYVSENPRVQSGLSVEGVAWAFTTTYLANWHPLTWLSHMVDVELFGLRAGWHHLTSVLFHAANTILLFLVFFRLSGATWRSGFVAALFALHPLHVESVAWVSERKDVLSAFFWILAMGAYARYAERPGVARYLPVAALFGLGLCTKPMVVTLPFVLLLLDVWPLGRIASLAQRAPGFRPRCPPVSPSRLVLEKVPLFAMTAVSCVITYVAQQEGGTLGVLSDHPWGDHTANAVASYAAYLGKTLWPASLAVFYPHPGASLPLWKVAGAGLLLAGVSVLAVRRLAHSPWLVVGWFWYLGTLVPVIGVVQVGEQAMADRYTYLPLIGIFIVVAWGIPELASRWRIRAPALAVGAALLLAALLAATWIQLGHWRSSEALWTRALEVTSDNWMAHCGLGMALTQQERFDEAIPQYREALRINPDFALAHNDLGVALGQKGEIGAAANHFLEALRLEPELAEAHTNLGVALHSQGRIEQAIPHYRASLRIEPEGALTHFYLGKALLGLGKTDEAIAHYRESLKLSPGNAAVLHELRMAGGADEW
jgi:Flp pilus assembly protein TadD